jgi:hypothetical protein
MNKKLLKLLLTMTLCLSISGCEFGDDDEEFDWGNFSICGNFEEYFGAFSTRRTASHNEEGTVLYGKCDTFSCTDAVITAACEGSLTSGDGVTDTCNGTTYNARGIDGAVAVTVDATGFFVEGEDDGSGGTNYTIGGEIVTTISDFKLNFSISSNTGYVECSGKLLFDDFETKEITCDSTSISCSVNDGSSSTTYDCEDIKAYYETNSSRSLCGAGSTAGTVPDLLELGLLKIEELIQAKE